MTIANETESDAVAMKNRIQAELLAERARMGEAEFNERRNEWLQSSEDALAVLWRGIGPAQKDE